MNNKILYILYGYGPRVWWVRNLCFLHVRHFRNVREPIEIFHMPA